jgi:hypothetical protein
MIWVAYNPYGDLIAEADDSVALWDTIEALGYCDEEVIVRVVFP